MNIFHACDIRGIAGGDLTDVAARKIALAVGLKLAGRQVVVGGDVRLSTPALQAIVIETLAESGCHVLDIGTVSTPAFSYALKKTAAVGGVMVTASHNPAPYNGFKLVLGPEPVSEADIADLARLVAAGARTEGSGSIARLPVAADYLAFTAACARRGSLKVVLDAGNGAVSRLAPQLFRSLGYDVVELYCQPDGNFPHRPPNPALAENLAALGAEVCRTGAALGAAFDGDGDRVGFVDETGRPLDNDDIIVLLARHYLARESGAVVYDAKCSMVVAEEIAKAGGRAVMARAGHTFSKQAFRRENALFAGEISGHFFFRELGYDDGAFAALKIAEIVAASGPLSVLADSVPDYLLTPDIRIPYPQPDKQAVIAAAAAALAPYRPNLIDGVRVEFPDGWGMIRASVTEPLFTFRFEAKTPARLAEIGDILLGALPASLREAVRPRIAAG
ncbi:phosphomannomutase/phosphoglucomutase [Anaeroselena agilis]|uniref:Phosphomannomutase/phosphoglucomutase n=1 Tax=Anaeroselena agilis TaxID=3063788 RepID=A0ABU3P1N3_9FIRM|nr:phosphomannomutase/phosphoglucomutase [Selenomonadales bacterium 4137-cl]